MLKQTAVFIVNV